MELTLFLATLALIFKSSLAVQCYKCEPQVEYGVKNLCHEFDKSDKFIYNCNISTMCYKKEVFMDFGDGTATRAITRGCAPQTLSDNQKLINGSWQYVYDIHEPYEEKCQVDNASEERRTTNTFCYCRGDLCNGASANVMGLQLLCVVVLGITVLRRFLV